MLRDITLRHKRAAPSLSLPLTPPEGKKAITPSTPYKYYLRTCLYFLEHSNSDSLVVFIYYINIEFCLMISSSAQETDEWCLSRKHCKISKFNNCWLAFCQRLVPSHKWRYSTHEVVFRFMINYCLQIRLKQK